MVPTLFVTPRIGQCVGQSPDGLTLRQAIPWPSSECAAGLCRRVAMPDVASYWVLFPLKSQFLFGFGGAFAYAKQVAAFAAGIMYVNETLPSASFAAPPPCRPDAPRPRTCSVSANATPTGTRYRPAALPHTSSRYRTVNSTALQADRTSPVRMSTSSSWARIRTRKELRHSTTTRTRGTEVGLLRHWDAEQKLSRVFVSAGEIGRFHLI